MMMIVMMLWLTCATARIRNTRVSASNDGRDDIRYDAKMQQIRTYNIRHAEHPINN